MTARLWAPWRMAYLTRARSGRSKKCLFCVKTDTRNPLKHRIIRRGRWAFSCLNEYPYANGHLLILPNRHVGRLQRLRTEESLEILQLIQDGIGRLTAVYRPDGFNVGLNLGRSAGGSVPGHLHWHLVPRWAGDHNFMSALGGTRVISEGLARTCRRLRAARR
ncbi:MAG: HIT family hydrolase [Candidatus Omnitrophica bacterium CG11_big_fil_rev_8_21_14_0_20_64_10]|nr:MAG: HIT family hydrolase [Candidatus Omnitrophica bacterium CG11_big_fil_rev_8_21_14_0_20_64_10]